MASFPQTKLADAADAILATLPPESGSNPIGVDPRYPWPSADAVEVIDDEHGGTRWVPRYVAFPVLDASGLFEWTDGPTVNEGKGTTQIVGGIDQAHVLAANVVIRGGDKSWSADYNPPTVEESEKPLVLEPLSTPPKHWTVVVKSEPAPDAPKMAPPETPIAEPVAPVLAPTKPGEPLPENHVAVHESFLKRLEELPADVWARLKGWL